jgi:hypothetical protein
MRIFICSRDGVVTRLDGDDASTHAQSVLEGVPVRCVAADGDRVIVGTQGAGVHPADGTLYAGTEPSRLFVLRDGAEWTELEALQDIPSRERWSFPPGHGPITSAGSHRTRIGGSGCWSPSSWTA